MSKHKFFAWLIFHDRINTRDMLLRRHWDVSGDHNYVYVHAKLWRIGLTYFLSATLALEPRNYLQIYWGSDSDPEMLQRAKKLFSGPCFVEIVILACWNIWKQLNGKIFKKERPSFGAWKAGFFYDGLWHKKCTVPFCHHGLTTCCNR